MKIAIIIPARYGSTRLPGKPLKMIAGQTMLSRVVDLARSVAADFDDVSVYVTTDDQRIADHAAEINVDCLMTGECPTGSDRVLAAAEQLSDTPDFVLNLQGDAPFTPPQAIKALIAAAKKNPEIEVITPVHRLSWDGLDRLRENKEITPFSGTTAVCDENGKALWFSKTIIPAIRQEDRSQDTSPILQHMGLYGYALPTLKKFCQMPQGSYEQLEGLEQLRFLENGISVQVTEIDVDHLHAGIDSPEDLERAEAFLTS